MAERIPLVIQPPKTTSPKVWLNGTWVDAVNTDVVVKGTDGKIDNSAISSEIAIANAPTWAQATAWTKGALCFYTGQLYRANDDIAAGTPFTIGVSGATWRIVVEASEVSSVPEWTVYNPTLDRPIKEGQLFYHGNALYRARVNNIGNDFNSNNHFEKLGGFVMPNPYVYTKSYAPGEIIRWQGYYVTPNSDIGGNVPFEWGSSSTALTWRPVLFNGYMQYTWRGLMVPGGQGFFQGDVIAPSARSNILYVCYTATAPAFGAETTPLAAYWAPLINDTPIVLDQYTKKGDVINPTVWKIGSVYSKNDMVVYTDGQVYMANADIPANTTWKIGTSGVTWKAVSGGAVTDFIANQAYPALQMVRNNGDIFIANDAIPANTTFVEGTTGATWKKIGASSNSVAVDVNYINTNIGQNTTNGAPLPLTLRSAKGMTVSGGGINLLANQTYLISANVYQNGAARFGNYQWSNNSATSTGSYLIGNQFAGATVSFTGNEGGSPTHTFVYTPTANETIYLKRISGDAINAPDYSSVSVIQISGTNGNLPIFQGATNTSAGKSGVIAAPEAGEDKKILFGSGEWKDPSELLSSEIAYVCGTISSFTEGSRTTGDLIGLYSTRNYGITCINNKIQLKANQTYLLTMSIHQSNGNKSAYGAYRWKNITTGSYIDQGELIISDCTGTVQSTGGQSSFVVYKPTANQEIAFVASRSQAMPGISDGYSQWAVVQIAGTAGSFPIFEGSTATVQGKAGALAAAPLNTQDYILYGSGEWKPLNAASSTQVITRGTTPTSTSGLGASNIFLDRQSRITVDGFLTKVTMRNYGVAGAVVVLRPQSGEGSFNATGKWDLVGTFPFASGATSVNPGIECKLGDYVGIWIPSGSGSSGGAYAANGPNNNLIWLPMTLMPTLPLTLTTGSGNTLGLSDLGFEVTTISNAAKPTYVSPQIAYGDFANTGSSSGFTGIWNVLIDKIGVTGGGTTLIMPAGTYLIEWTFALSGYSTSNSYAYSSIGNDGNTTIVKTSTAIDFISQQSTYNENNAPVGTALVKNTAVGNMKVKLTVSIGSGNASPQQSRTWWKITKLE